MTKTIWQRGLLLMAGLAALGALAGCSGSAGKTPAAAVTAPATAVAKAATGFTGSEKAGDINVTLGIEPYKPGVSNHFIVTVDRKDIKAAEVQAVMATMGHGQVVDLTQTAPGKWEVDSDALPMDGSWLFRVELTTPDDQYPAALFHGMVNQ